VRARSKLSGALKTGFTSWSSSEPARKQEKSHEAGRSHKLLHVSAGSGSEEFETPALLVEKSPFRLMQWSTLSRGDLMLKGSTHSMLSGFNMGSICPTSTGSRTESTSEERETTPATEVGEEAVSADNEDSTSE
jgi:hypothetical protein